ncbi:MAG: FAD-dependent oxidoreductase [Acidimicrobiales bacterium]|nr:FAD-dependent oxidoreductase [Acidimicrobiales bacterium]
MRPTRFVIIGGGPGGNTAASYAARHGAEVVLIEREIIGGAAHLWDCIPSKSMIATGGAMSFLARAGRMGLGDVKPRIDVGNLASRLAGVEHRINRSTTSMLEGQRVRVIEGTGSLQGPHQVVAETVDGLEEIEADVVVLSTGSRPRVPDWAPVDGERILTTREAYPPAEMPDHLVVIGSGVTGVEFVHMFKSFGCEVTLVVSRQQVLPQKDPEVAAALEADFLRRGVRLFKGARARSIERDGDEVSVHCDDGRKATGSHIILAVGSLPNSEGLGLDNVGIETKGGYIPIDPYCRTSVPHIYAAGDVSGKLPLSSVAQMQGRKIAEHAMGLSDDRRHRVLDYDKAASAVFTEPEIADVGLAEADAFAEGRKIRVTKVPFTASAKAVINDDPRGFIKIVSDPATGVVLGGSIVGLHAAELIAIIALAVSSGLTVHDIKESLFVHPTLAEALADAAE